MLSFFIQQPDNKSRPLDAVFNFRAFLIRRSAQIHFGDPDSGRDQAIERLISPTRSTNGYIMNMRTDMQRVEKPMRFFQEEVPIVLGTISANSSINRVKIPEMIPNQVLPNSSVACRPTPAAPIVLAMVFRERIAASGFSVSVLYSRNLVAGLYPCSFFIVMKESGVDNSTDSSMEQRNETSSVPMRNIKRSPINDPNNMQI